MRTRLKNRPRVPIKNCPPDGDDRRATIHVTPTSARAAIGLGLLALALLALPVSPAAALRVADSHGRVHGITLRDGAHAPAIRTAATPFATGDLVWGGGAVMHSNRTHTVYWDPSATIPTGYRSAIDGFLQNVAADSGKQTNVYSVGTQYYDGSGNLSYSSTFGGALTDTDAYPASGCAPSSPRTVCLTDAQIQAELAAYIAHNHLPTGLGDIYFVLTPGSVDTCFDSSTTNPTCDYNYYCAYHGNFVSGGQTILYADDPYPDGGCWLDDYPNGPGTAADEAINTLSHEHNETITDPQLDAWADPSGEEDGDKCATTFGPLLGGASGAGYDQAIATGHYYLQEEWSNAISGCAAQTSGQPVASLAVTPTSATPGQQVSFDATASTGPISAYSISFGDGTSGSGALESHVYATPGTYTVTLAVTGSGGTSASVSRTVTITDRPPACSSTSAAAGGAVAVTLACSDPDPGDGLARAIVSGPAHGSLGPIDQAAGTVAYTPAPGFSGTDSFTFRATDSHGATSATAIATVYVPAAPQPPPPTVPLVGPLRLTRTVFKLGPHGAPANARITYTVAQRGVTTFFLERAVSGVRRGGRCVSASSRPSRGAACRTYARLRGAFTRQDAPGTTSVRLAAILRHFSLRLGTYRLVAVFRGSGGASGKATTRFRISGRA
jgi:PKD repeat protein